LVWIVDPASRTVTVYEADGAARRLRAADALNGGAVLPGFRCAVADLFPPA
jgi:Uma2 family endonuclease